MKRIARSALLPMLLTAVVCLNFMPPARADGQQLDLAADALKSPSDPPVIPHAVKPDQNGAECNACHRTGVGNAPPTSHPERLNCTSCHVQGALKPERKATGKGKRK